MGQSGHAIFDESVWTPALEKFGAVTHMRDGLWRG